MSNKTKYRLQALSLVDGVQCCQGYISEEHWNGWAVPRVDQANLALFLQHQDKLTAAGDEVVTGKLEGKTLVLLDGKVTPEFIEHEGKRIEVWNIGLCLSWAEFEGNPEQPQDPREQIKEAGFFESWTAPDGRGVEYGCYKLTRKGSAYQVEHDREGFKMLFETLADLTAWGKATL